MKKFIRENFILLFATLFLVGGFFLYYFRTSYKTFVVDYHFSKTVAATLKHYELVAVVDEESYTIQNTAETVASPHEIRLKKVEDKTTFSDTYPQFYAAEMPNFLTGELENLSLKQSQPLFLFNIKNGVNFGELQALSPKYLTSFSKAKEIVSRLFKVYDEDLAPDFLYSLYAYEGNLGNFLTYTHSRKLMLWYNGENLAIYQLIGK